MYPYTRALEGTLKCTGFAMQIILYLNCDYRSQSLVYIGGGRRGEWTAIRNREDGRRHAKQTKNSVDFKPPILNFYTLIKLL